MVKLQFGLKHFYLWNMNEEITYTVYISCMLTFFQNVKGIHLATVVGLNITCVEVTGSDEELVQSDHILYVRAVAKLTRWCFSCSK